MRIEGWQSELDAPVATAESSSLGLMPAGSPNVKARGRARGSLIVLILVFDHRLLANFIQILSWIRIQKRFDKNLFARFAF